MEKLNAKPLADLKPSSVQRMTRQRQAIIRVLASTKEHPTAEEIHAQVRDELPDISIGTIYRNLQMLLADGLVQEISLGRSGARFDANQQPHSHFFCRKCGRVYDVPAYETPPTPEITRQIPGRLDSQRTDFFGVCSACLKQAKHNA